MGRIDERLLDKVTLCEHHLREYVTEYGYSGSATEGDSEECLECCMASKPDPLPLCPACGNTVKGNVGYGCVLYLHPLGPDGGGIDNWHDSWEENGLCSAKCAIQWIGGK